MSSILRTLLRMSLLDFMRMKKGQYVIDPPTLPLVIEEKTSRHNTYYYFLQCLDRDGNACLVTGAAYPQACHIIPFAFSTNELNFGLCWFLMFYAGFLFGREDWEHTSHFISEELRASDKDSNMPSLSPLVRDWWRKGLLAFVCLGSRRQKRTRCWLQSNPKFG